MVKMKGMRFPKEVILVYIRWYAAYALSYRDLEEMMQEHGVSVDHSTVVNRWVIRFSPCETMPTCFHNKEGALDCSECHAREGRLAELEGFYLPGRDSNWWLDTLGLLAVFGTLAGALGHGLIRIISNKGRKQA